MALLSLVQRDLAEAGMTVRASGVLTNAGMRGRRCLLLGNREGFAFLCLPELDSLGRVRELLITNDPQYDFEVLPD